MSPKLSNPLNVVVLRNEPAKTLGQIQDVDPSRISVENLWDSVLPELYYDWPKSLVDRFARLHTSDNAFTSETLNEKLANAHVLLAGYPYPKNLLRRMPRLIWAHWGFAGISNLYESDFWGSDVTCTSSRGFSGALPIAESVIGAILMFTRQLHLAVLQTASQEFDENSYKVALTAGKTVGIIGLGGIGKNVARLSKGLGMNVLATRLSAKKRTNKIPFVDMLYPASEMNIMLESCDFVVISAMWTEQTEKLLNKKAFTSMKKKPYLINVARGELIDDQAFISSLDSGRVSGAYLDVYRDEFKRPPNPKLISHPRVFMSPHISQRSDGNQQISLELFCSNLERFLNGKKLVNVIDWKRGY